jgi:hypothetical protein
MIIIFVEIIFIFSLKKTISVHREKSTLTVEKFLIMKSVIFITFFVGITAGSNSTTEINQVSSIFFEQNLTKVKAIPFNLI